MNYRKSVLKWWSKLVSRQQQHTTGHGYQIELISSTANAVHSFRLLSSTLIFSLFLSLSVLLFIVLFSPSLCHFHGLIFAKSGCIYPNDFIACSVHFIGRPLKNVCFFSTILTMFSRSPSACVCVCALRPPKKSSACLPSGIHCRCECHCWLLPAGNGDEYFVIIHPNALCCFGMH